MSFIDNSRVRSCSTCRPVYLPRLNNRFKWKSEPKIRRRITIAKSAMQQTYKSVWNAHIALSTKLRLYNTCIRPIVLYASECWAPTKANVARLDAFYQRCLRHILGLTWQDHITTVEVHERTAISETISQHRLPMLGRKSRKPPYKAIPSDWQRRPSRPRQS